MAQKADKKFWIFQKSKIRKLGTEWVLQISYARYIQNFIYILDVWYRWSIEVILTQPVATWRAEFWVIIIIIMVLFYIFIQEFWVSEPGMTIR